ncbi:hypothetical protein M408DRAFT_29051 [Serendipita vermifera MAFF 305830]|uniref:Histone acetyltransferase n=1 Tax=Serendipita vermifera MAFF 305830 TaxID=933852 RepID=A0A0C2W6J5_SERVB|nr:hypothetical protein M408DRAFT_29051 [Serendipita vermifera MAFF 305830]
MSPTAFFSAVQNTASSTLNKLRQNPRHSRQFRYYLSKLQYPLQVVPINKNGTMLIPLRDANKEYHPWAAALFSLFHETNHQDSGYRAKFIRKLKEHFTTKEPLLRTHDVLKNDTFVREIEWIDAQDVGDREIENGNKRTKEDSEDLVNAMSDEDEMKVEASLYYGPCLVDKKIKTPTHVCDRCFYETDSTQALQHHMEGVGTEDEHAQFIDTLEAQGDGIEVPEGYALYCLKEDGNPASSQARLKHMRDVLSFITLLVPGRILDGTGGRKGDYITLLYDKTTQRFAGHYSRFNRLLDVIAIFPGYQHKGLSTVLWEHAYYTYHLGQALDQKRLVSGPERLSSPAGFHSWARFKLDELTKWLNEHCIDPEDKTPQATFTRKELAELLAVELEELLLLLHVGTELRDSPLLAFSFTFNGQITLRWQEMKVEDGRLATNA